MLTSKYVGVSFSKRGGRWVAQISFNKKKKHLGYFDTELEASNVYQKELLTRSSRNLL